MEPLIILCFLVGTPVLIALIIMLFIGMKEFYEEGQYGYLLVVLYVVFVVIFAIWATFDYLNRMGGDT